MATELVEVAFKNRRFGIYANPLPLSLKPGDYVIVEADKGEDLGKVEQLGSIPYYSDEPLKNVMRLATPKDLEKLEENRKLEEQAFKVCRQKIVKHQLNMSLVDVEYQWDRKKLTFYFTSDQRVDFRELVKDLAGKYKTRIELRQIGVRDAAKHIGGYGVCGYQICCTTFLKDFESITTQFAKDQLLPMNPSKLTGACGRLKCCLSYERQFYLQELEHYPPLDTEIQTPLGKGTVEKIDIFNGFIFVRFDGDTVERFTLDEIRAFKSEMKDEKTVSEKS